MSPIVRRRGRPAVLLITTVIALLAASLPVSAPAVADLQHSIKVDNPDYQKKYGSWKVVNLPKEFQLNTIHASSLPDGKVLLVAGSGNNRANFNAFHDNGTIAVLKTAVYNPADGSMKMVATPSDLFCSGHAMLESGKVLIAGGTSGYELLASDVKKPAGGMTIHNEDPDSPTRTFKKGTKFIGPNGKTYLSTQDVTVEPAMKMTEADGNVTVMHSSARVFVEAVKADKSYVADKNQQYKIAGLSGDDTHNIYGQGDAMTLGKQDYRGDNKAYEFDPVTETYQQVGDMKESRWYASLPLLADGQVMAVSGLDATGQIAETTEIFNPDSKQWTLGVDHQFPTYPALFRTADPDVLFFSGSSAGYGPADQNRQPGFWNFKTNAFTAVSGLRQSNILETSGSVFLPPPKGSNDGTQSSKVMLAGGGGVGESKLSTARTDIIDLASPTPKYTPGPNLPDTLRYLNLTVTPWDEVIADGGSTDYRAKHNSYSYKTFSLDGSKTVTPLADEVVGRSYHSGSVLLRDGRILVFGNDPLFSDKKDTAPGTFEQRLEIYTPPQLYKSKQPTLSGPDSQVVHRGQTLEFSSPDAASLKTARLIPPSTTTHVTNIEQRSVAAIVHSSGTSVTVDLPTDATYLSNGWYMLFTVNASGTPSVAKMVQVTD